MDVVDLGDWASGEFYVLTLNNITYSFFCLYQSGEKSPLFPQQVSLFLTFSSESSQDQEHKNPFLSISLLRQDHHSNLWALAIKGPYLATLNVFRSNKVLPLESITSFGDLRSEGGGWGGGGGVQEEKGAQGFMVTKCRGQAGCVVTVLISGACSAYVAGTLTLK